VQADDFDGAVGARFGGFRRGGICHGEA